MPAAVTVPTVMASPAPEKMAAFPFVHATPPSQFWSEVFQLSEGPPVFQVWSAANALTASTAAKPVEVSITG